MLALRANERGDFVGAVIRLAFHDAAEFDQTASDTLRFDGCINLADAGNNGLGPTIATLETMWRPHCAFISRADYWYLAAKAVLETVTTNSPADFAIPFTYGREDVAACTYSDFTDLELSRLPGAEHGMDELERVFVTQMGLTLRDATALIGAHTLGRAQAAISGYNGPWELTPPGSTMPFFKTSSMTPGLVGL